MGKVEKVEQKVEALCGAQRFQEAATEALECYGPGILGLLVKMSRDGDIANEIFSSFCEDLWKGLPGFRWEASVKNWMYRMAIHAHHRYMRDPLRKRGQRLETDAAHRLPEVIKSVTQNYRRTSIKDRFETLRVNLTPQEQALLTLRLDRDMSWDEIAVVMLEEDPEKEAVKKEAQRQRKRFSRLKVKLARLIEEQGLIEKDE